MATIVMLTRIKEDDKVCINIIICFGIYLPIALYTGEVSSVLA